MKTQTCMQVRCYRVSGSVRNQCLFHLPSILGCPSSQVHGGEIGLKNYQIKSNNFLDILTVTDGTWIPDLGKNLGGDFVYNGNCSFGLYGRRPGDTDLEYLE